MSADKKAIFLSYTSQDAPAAQRLCAALSGAGLDVWFDQSELRGGDAWDASIRNQIKECALFVPLISANTESRTEGYFRLEWRLAEQRSHLMAKRRAFILPVAIDATPEANANVPDAFLEVQWTRLPASAGGEAFAAHIKQLLRDDAAPTAGVQHASTATTTPSRTASKGKRWPKLVAWVGAAALMVGIAYHFMGNPRSASDTAKAAPGSSQDYVNKARKLLDADPLVTRRNLELAEQLAMEAIAKDPGNAEAFAAAAWANYRFLELPYDDTPKRKADLRTYAEKAKLLAPDSINAELAACGVLLSTMSIDPGITCLTNLQSRAPGNLEVLRTHAWIAATSPKRGDTARADPKWQSTKDGHEEIFAKLRAHSKLGRSFADSYLALIHWGRGEYAQCERVVNSVFASGTPVTQSYLTRMLVLLYGWGDIEAARQFVGEIPQNLLLEDVFISHVSTLWMRVGDYEQALATLSRSQRDVLREARVDEPTAMRRGDAHAAAGRKSAAVTQWREALKIVDRQIELNPNNLGAHMNRERLLGLLNERSAAAKQHALLSELDPMAPGSLADATRFEYHFLAGDLDGAIKRLDRFMVRENGRWPNYYNVIRFDPAMRPLRDHPRMQPVMKRAEAWMTEMRKDRSPRPSQP